MLALGVPNVFVMLSIVTAITIPWISQVYPACCYLLLHRNMCTRHQHYSTIYNTDAVIDGSIESEPSPRGNTSIIVSDGREDRFVESLARSSSFKSLASEHLLGLPLKSNEYYTRSFICGAYFVLFTGLLTFLLCAAAAYGKIYVEEIRGPNSIGCLF